MGLMYEEIRTVLKNCLNYEQLSIPPYEETKKPMILPISRVIKTDITYWIIVKSYIYQTEK